MIRRLVHLQLLGPQQDLVSTVESLQRLGCAEVVAAPYRVAAGPSAEPRSTGTDPDAPGELLARVQRLLDLAPTDPATASAPQAPTAPTAANGSAATTGQTHAAQLSDLLDLRAAREPDLALLELEVDILRGRQAALEEERDRLAHYVEILGELEALVPELGTLSDAELEVLGLAMMALVLDDPAGMVVSLLDSQLRQEFGESYLLQSTGEGRSRGCLLVVPRDRLGEAESLVGSDQISQVSVPDTYAHLSLHLTVVRMRGRLAAVEGELTAVQTDLAAVWLRVLPSLHAAARALRVIGERDAAVNTAELTSRTFLLRCWAPADRRADLERQLNDAGLAGVTVIDAPSAEVPGPSPVELSGRAAWAPYRKMVGFLSWPSPGGFDPSGLLALALPFLFGVMVGDVVYGAALMGVGWWLRRRANGSRSGTGVLDDAGRVLMAGGAWAVVWGVLFGEALGSLGNTLGMPALWFYRGGPAALEPLLLFAVALGWSHIVLGLSIGLVTALRRGDRHRVLEAGGTLAVLLSLTGLIVAVVLDAPTWLVLATAVPALAGLVATSSAHGPLGALLGPLELIGTVGNVLVLPADRRGGAGLGLPGQRRQRTRHRATPADRTAGGHVPAPAEPRARRVQPDGAGPPAALRGVLQQVPRRRGPGLPAPRRPRPIPSSRSATRRPAPPCASEPRTPSTKGDTHGNRTHRPRRGPRRRTLSPGHRIRPSSHRRGRDGRDRREARARWPCHPPGRHPRDPGHPGLRGRGHDRAAPGRLR